MSVGRNPSDDTEDAGLAARRGAMVLEQLAKRGIRDARVLAAMAAVPRHRFVDTLLEADAYDDRPLPIGFRQTISQPYMVARATELAAPQPSDRALEVGAGCGYQSAILAHLCAAVFAVEIIPSLAERARATLQGLGYANTTIESFDGSGGWPGHAPYDVIIVSAGAPRVPPLLIDQLTEQGRLVLPLGPPDDQALALVRRIGAEYQVTMDTRCRYVDLLGRFGFGSTPASA